MLIYFVKYYLFKNMKGDIMIDFENFMKKLKLNKKGQAFSTFQLLIAAVVALALLGVLLPIIMKNVNIGGNPEESAQTLIRSQINSVGSLRYTESVKFKNGDSISAPALAEGTGLSRQQVCIVSPGSNFSGDSGASITYNSSSTLSYQIGVLCDYKDEMQASLGQFTSEIPDGASLCESRFADFSSEKVCIVFPKRA